MITFPKMSIYFFRGEEATREGGNNTNAGKPAAGDGGSRKNVEQVIFSHFGTNTDSCLTHAQTAGE